MGVATCSCAFSLQAFYTLGEGGKQEFTLLIHSGCCVGAVSPWGSSMRLSGSCTLVTRQMWGPSKGTQTPEARCGRDVHTSVGALFFWLHDDSRVTSLTQTPQGMEKRVCLLWWKCLEHGSPHSLAWPWRSPSPGQPVQWSECPGVGALLAPQGLGCRGTWHPSVGWPWNGEYRVF